VITGVRVHLRVLRHLSLELHPDELFFLRCGDRRERELRPPDRRVEVVQKYLILRERWANGKSGHEATARRTGFEPVSGRKAC